MISQEVADSHDPHRNGRFNSPTSNDDLIARLRRKADYAKRVGMPSVVLVLNEAADALEAQSAPLPGTVQDALDLLDSIHGDAMIQYHAYASLHDAISRIAQSAPLVADSREAQRVIHRALKPLVGRPDWAEDDTAIGAHAARILEALFASSVVVLREHDEREIADRARHELLDAVYAVGVETFGGQEYVSTAILESEAKALDHRN